MPSDKQLWGGETAKAVENFPISGETVPVSVIHWLARLKGAAAAVNGELGLLSKRRASRIEKAAAEIAAGLHDRQFPIDVFQTGSGTSTNMNANEVIASLAGDGVHANDHVNMGQSSNDVFPSAVHLAALDVAQNELLQCRQQLVLGDVQSGQVNGGGEHVVGGLAHVDVVVGVHAVACEARDDLVGVHVRGGARTGLEDVDRELAV